MRVLGRVLSIWAAMVLLACGDAGTEDRTKAQVRLVNASSGYAQLEMREGGELRQSTVGYGASADYMNIAPSPGDLTIHASGSPTALATLTPQLTKAQHYSLLAFGPAGALRQVMLDDNQGEPERDRTLLRVINAAPDAGALDVYVTAPNETLAASVPLQAGAAYGSVGSWFNLTSGSWRLRVAAAGSKTDLRLDLGSFGLASRDRLTLVLTPSSSGVLVNALVLVQQGALQRRDVAHARVRAVAGVSEGASVSAAVGGVNLINAVGSPAVSNYQLVSAGSVTPVLAVDGAALTGPPATLAAGGDYTLMVYGARAAPAATWIADDNSAPLAGGTARMRLVSGLAGASGPLALKLQSTPLADGVMPGAGSAYADADAVASGEVAVTAPGTALPLFRATEQAVLAGQVYTVFVLGDAAAAPSGIVRKDR